MRVTKDVDVMDAGAMRELLSCEGLKTYDKLRGDALEAVRDVLDDMTTSGTDWTWRDVNDWMRDDCADYLRDVHGLGLDGLDDIASLIADYMVGLDVVKGDESDETWRACESLANEFRYNGWTFDDVESAFRGATGVWWTVTSYTTVDDAEYRLDDGWRELFTDLGVTVWTQV